jgi:hypothetical protein
LVLVAQQAALALTEQQDQTLFSQRLPQLAAAAVAVTQALQEKAGPVAQAVVTLVTSAVDQVVQGHLRKVIQEATALLTQVAVAVALVQLVVMALETLQVVLGA